MSDDSKVEQAFRDVAAASEATYNRYASQHELYRIAMDIAKLWVKRNPVKD